MKKDFNFLFFYKIHTHTNYLKYTLTKINLKYTFVSPLFKLQHISWMETVLH